MHKNGGKALLEFLEVTEACFNPLEKDPDSGDEFTWVPSSSRPPHDTPILLTPSCPLTRHM